ncbi:TRAP transporter small permease subunit [Kushneria marisflavi]|uniref:TRAP transporter small permease protein n=1 Tax=Kushneria marisflavi TaxID=157779 RepID=A0A240UNQ1_9GAMM|nr:TRAP transporter small permease subunit [Kushneria marisflavi]ART63137.1 hypothetical protein B9H00_08780 [Kushneria marisflavi]RKD84607.1 TRAP-type C4-dicarboxylate transport system permease small subunit [Kushneria marisflavi]
MSNQTLRKPAFQWDELPAWLFMVVIFAMTWEVVSRYFFLAPTSWANELSLYVCAIAYVYAGVFVMRRDAHLRVTVLYDLAPRRLRRALDVVQCLMTLCFCLIVAGFGAREAWVALINGERFGTVWNAPIPMTLKPLIVICALVMAVMSVINLYRRWHQQERDS